MSDVSDSRFRIIDALNKAINNNLTRRQFLDNFIISDPSRATGTLPRKNTIVKVTPLLGSKYYGIKTVWYNRIHISELGFIFVTRTNENTVVDLLPQINEKYKLFFTEDDVEDEILTSTQIGTFEIQLNIKHTSLMFYGDGFITTVDTVPPINNNHHLGALINTYCDQFNKYGVFSDGNGGTYQQLIELNSSECGYNGDETIYLVLDGGGASTTYSNNWQTAGTVGAG